jgi:hypothetical protein
VEDVAVQSEGGQGSRLAPNVELELGKLESVESIYRGIWEEERFVEQNQRPEVELASRHQPEGDGQDGQVEPLGN